MPLIHIDNLVSFASNVGVLVHPEALEIPTEKLREVLLLAYKHIDDEILLDACCGGCGPLAKYMELSFEEYLRLKEAARINQAGQVAKTAHTKVRRISFNAKRSQLILAMIEARIAHICAYQDCDVTENLTIDHIVPLSRGGTDDLSNLQFLCRLHNSAKRDTRDEARTPAKR
jgi:hypothetical protein